MFGSELTSDDDDDSAAFESTRALRFSARATRCTCDSIVAAVALQVSVGDDGKDVYETTPLTPTRKPI